MKMSNLTYRDLDRVMERIGMTSYWTKDGFRLYRYGATDAIVLFRGEPADEMVPIVDLIATQLSLDALGVIESSAFDRALADVTEMRVA